MSIKDDISGRKAAGSQQAAPHIDPALVGTLAEGESVVHAAQISNGIYWKGIAVVFLALLCFSSTMFFNLGWFFSFVALVILGFEAATKHYLMLVLTNKRVFVRYGIIQLDTVQVRVNRIESVEVERPLMGRLLGLAGFGYGRVVISGTGSRVMVVPFVENALAFRQALDAVMHEREED